MNVKVFVSNWELVDEEKVKLTFDDGDIVYVRKDDFNRAFGAILGADKEAVIRDFGID